MTDSDLYVYRAEAVNVVDGDTFDVRIDLGFRTWRRERVRLLGVNCPELHGPGSMQSGVEARAFTVSRVVNQPILIRSVGQDNFGRWLAKVTLPDGTDLGESLVGAGLARPFMVPKG